MNPSLPGRSLSERGNLGDLIADGVDAAKPAVIDLSGPQPRTVGYGALAAMAHAVARALQAGGLQRGERVALLSANSSESLAAYLGIMQAGGVAVPVNHRFPRELTDFILRDAQATMVFCDPERIEACPADLPVVVMGLGAGAPLPERGLRFETWIDPGPFEPVMPVDDEAAMFLYTSGSTGRPKGVVLSHRSHRWVVRTRLEGQDWARHRFLIAAPLYHMNALALSKLVLAAGATMVLLPQFTAGAYIDAIERYRCTWLTAVPPMIAMMLREAEHVARTDLSSVEFLRMGSAPVSPSLLEAIHRVMPRVKVMNAFGSTEGGPVVFGPHPEGKPQPTLSVGCAHPKVQLRLVDDSGAPTDQGVLQMKCPGVMTGYHNRPDVKPPFTADGYYVTGDVFRRDADGFHYFVGRSDDMFVCGGENVHPGELEKLLESHPDIVQACVVPIDDDIKGQKPVAFCVLRPGAALTEAEVKQYTLERGPAYRHPRFVWFLDRLPLSATSKIDRKGLQQQARDHLSARNA